MTKKSVSHGTRTEMKRAEAPDAQTFESQLAALEKIVRELERGDLPLEESLRLFEQGVRLSRECQERLNQAERRIELLLAAFDEDEEELHLDSGGEADVDESVF
jgi:exodeoxyribonuclease VII small subunit